MRVFRRNSTGPPSGTAEDPAQSQEAPAKAKPPAQAGKGHPTPKRSVAEKGRYQSITGSSRSGSSRSGSSRSGASGSPPPADRADRARRYEAMKRGEDWALNARDRGPVR